MKRPLTLLVMLFAASPYLPAPAQLNDLDKALEAMQERLSTSKTTPAPKAGTPVAVDLNKINCGNLVYAKNQTSVCLADKFLEKVNQETHLDVNPKFVRVPLQSDELFNFPFAVFSGEGSFSLSTEQREQLYEYLSRGGFILASPGCSDNGWDRAFRKEVKLAFPEYEMQKVQMDHPMFKMVYDIPVLTDKKGNKVLVEGLFIKGRLAMIYSTEGLNDVGNAKGCCCCGGNEIRQAQHVNVNIIVYSLMH